MPDDASAQTAERALVAILRIVGSVSLLATIFVFVPYSWMNAIHGTLGMGELPAAPIVGYLARSTSAFYAMLGGLLWVVSYDVRRSRAVLTYLGLTLSAFGVILVGVDWGEGLPLFWKAGEGPFVLVLGLAITFLNHRVDGDERATGDGES